MKEDLSVKKIDPVCGMNLSKFPEIKKKSILGGDFYFCSSDCESKFKNNPEKFKGDPLIRLEDVWKIFKISNVETKVLRGLSLNIWPGDFVAIIGASGSGKSTALNIMGLLDTPTSGKIFLNGKDFSTLNETEKAELRSKTFGFIFQQYNLVPWLTAYENVSLPLIFSNTDVRQDRLEKEFKNIGLEDRLKHRPFELSGGEQQRVALLRALANDPSIIIGDEPTGNLDSETGDKILEILIDLNKKKKKTLIIVTHDSEIAEKADQIIAIKDGSVALGGHKHKKIYTE